VGRFFAVDPLFKDYPYNSSYAFSENRVLDAIELEGLEAFFIHGTILNMFGGRESTFTFEKNSLGQDKYIVQKLTPVLNNKTSNVDFSWDGKNSDNARHTAAQQLVEHVLKNRKPGEPISLTGCVRFHLPTNESCLILTISLWNSIFRPKIGYEPYLFFTRSQIERLLFYKLVDGRENLI
jgi:hypothetical protein